MTPSSWNRWKCYFADQLSVSDIWHLNGKLTSCSLQFSPSNSPHMIRYVIIDVLRFNNGENGFRARHHRQLNGRYPTATESVLCSHWPLAVHVWRNFILPLHFTCDCQRLRTKSPVLLSSHLSFVIIFGIMVVIFEIYPCSDSNKLTISTVFSSFH